MMSNGDNLEVCQKGIPQDIRLNIPEHVLRQEQVICPRQ